MPTVCCRRPPRDEVRRRPAGGWRRVLDGVADRRDSRFARRLRTSTSIFLISSTRLSSYHSCSGGLAHFANGAQSAGVSQPSLRPCRPSVQAGSLSFRRAWRSSSTGLGGGWAARRGRRCPDQEHRERRQARASAARPVVPHTQVVTAWMNLSVNCAGERGCLLSAPEGLSGYVSYSRQPPQPAWRLSARRVVPAIGHSEDDGLDGVCPDISYDGAHQQPRQRRFRPGRAFPCASTPRAT